MMTELLYHCTSCDLVFPDIGTMSGHIKRDHEAPFTEDALERVRRRAQELGDEDEDDDDDEGEDQLLPSDPRAARKELERVRKVSTVWISERNAPALESVLAELGRLQTHWDLAGAELARLSYEAGKVRELVEWVLHSDCGLES
jgi:hypothetical protein